MHFDRSWNTLLDPGNAFDFLQGSDNISFDPQPGYFDPATAWWLSELSRLVYIRETDEPDGIMPAGTRSRFLFAAGLEEVAFINICGTKCSVIKTVESGDRSWAAVVFRGTHNLENWMSNLDTSPVSWDGPGQVHKGFRDAFKPVWKPLVQLLNELSCPVFYTGHSLGAALAMLAAVKHPPAALYTFGSPMTGDRPFVDALNGIPVYRVVNNRDIVTQLPPPILGFRHAGELHTLSPDLPDESFLPEDLAVRDLADRAIFISLVSGWYTEMSRPADFLSDHAPVNYTAAIERELLSI
jgi:hypothetical protein